MREQIKARPLTQKELRVKNFITDYAKENGMTPTFAEIMKQFGMKSKAQVAYFVDQLHLKGHIQRGAAHTARNIIVLGVCPCCNRPI